MRSSRSAWALNEFKQLNETLSNNNKNNKNTKTGWGYSLVSRCSGYEKKRKDLEKPHWIQPCVCAALCQLKIKVTKTKMSFCYQHAQLEQPPSSVRHSLQSSPLHPQYNPERGRPVLAHHPSCSELSHGGCSLVCSFENLFRPFSHVAKVEDRRWRQKSPGHRIWGKRHQH